MRKKCPVFALIFLLTLLFYTPASAATEYGVIYDETDALGSQTLKMQGEQTLPQLTETLGIDLRVEGVRTFFGTYLRNFLSFSASMSMQSVGTRISSSTMPIAAVESTYSPETVSKI